MIKPSEETLNNTIKSCILNGEKLQEESYDLEFRDPPSLQLYLLLIAQEEFSKAFILILVRAGIIPFSRPLLRAMNDHACKQLVGLIMDYITPQWESLDEAIEMARVDAELGDRLPPAVESAIMLLRFEKVGRWESRNWDWECPPSYESGAKKISDGQADRRKQDALYVRIGGDGRVIPSNTITPGEISNEQERLRNFKYLTNSLLEGSGGTNRYDKAISYLSSLFAQRI